MIAGDLAGPQILRVEYFQQFVPDLIGFHPRNGGV